MIERTPRGELVAGGLDPDQLLRVSGFADRVLLADTAPTDPINRRIELVVLLPEIAEAIRNPGVLAPDAQFSEEEVPKELVPQNTPQANDDQ